MRALQNALTLTAVLVVAVSRPAWSQSPVARIACIDVQRVQVRSAAGVAARDQLEREKAGMQQKMDAKRKELETLRDELEKKGPLMTAEARRDKQDAFERNRRDAARLADDLQKELEKKEQQLLQHVLQDLSGVIEKVGKERGLVLIVEKRGAAVLYGAPEADLTDEIIRAYDQQNAPERDAQCEALIVDRLRSAFAGDAILAEETGTTAGRSGRRWIVDPLDGTTNYAHGLPIYAVSIALEVDHRVVLGVVYDPTRDELFVAERGRGATVNDVALAVSDTATLDESLLATGFPYNIRESHANLAEFTAFTLRSRAVRRLGSAVLYCAWVAAGRFDGYWEQTTGPWDVAAGSLLIEEAGGRVTDLVGKPLDLDKPSIVASNGNIHAAMLGILAEVRGR